MSQNMQRLSLETGYSFEVHTAEWCNAALIELSPRFAAALKGFRLCKMS